ncbi:MAG: hypothetical protein KKA73_29835, partial [Chloroflexi bacterium]|nr:hypothetical protein [Chloroflexota bacterium]
MNVLYLYPIDEAHLALLHAQLDPGVAVFVPPTFLNADGALVGEGPAGLQGAEDQVALADVMVANWADPAVLAQAARLQTFIIP